MNSSAEGTSAKPPMSAPMNEKPDRPRFENIGIVARSADQSDTLSPGQTAAHRWPPAKVARVSTNGRSSGRRRARPSKVARELSWP